MKELLFGTTNQAKLLQVRGALLAAGINVYGISDKGNLPDIVEDGRTASENAKKKAIAYAKALQKIVFSMDNALYLKGLSDDKQPGLHVRRINGTSERPTDEEILRYYSKLIANLGGKIDGYWEYGICIAAPKGQYRETVIRTPRTYVSNPSKVIQPGYPLESLQIDPESGKYMSELTRKEQDIFWQKAIGEKLLEFVKSVDFT